MDTYVRAATSEEIAAAEARAAAAVMAAIPPPKFVGDAQRTLEVKLQYPVEYDGVIYQSVTIRRPTMREWRAYLRECERAVKLHGPGADDDVNQSWLSVPAVVLENLDFIDASQVEAAQEGFFGRSALDPQDGKGNQAESGQASEGSPTSESGSSSPSQ